MSLFRRIFSIGRMNSDVDNRLLPQGEYREALNAVIINSEGSKEGSVQKSLSNKRLTNLSLGANPITIGEKTYEARNRIYWLVKSDTGCFLIEWDDKSQSASFVLQDTRSLADRVFNLNENYLCTHIDIIPAQDEADELMFVTVGNLEPLCFNISRAKTYGLNGFDAEDIYLIKKPPRLAPITQLLNNGSVENNLLERFVAFCYRYKYLDGEYSAFSTFSNYRFIPGKADIDYETFEDLGMVNAFNEVRIGFNTGDKRVVAVQLIFKNSGSNTPYLIDTFVKSEQGWGDDETRYHKFTNNKLYTVLPERELFRTFDNVPRRAFAGCVIGNKPFYGNYTENYDLLDVNNKPIAVDFTLSLKTESLEGANVPKTLIDVDETDDAISLNLTGISLKAGTRLSFDITLEESTYGEGSYNQSTEFILNRDYTDATDLATDEDFITFVAQGLTNNFSANYDAVPPADSSVEAINGFTIIANTATSITIKGPSIVYKIDDTPGDTGDDVFHLETSYWSFTDDTVVLFFENESAATIKTNRSVEVCLLYEDKWGRKTTALTSVQNTIFIPQKFSTSKNSLLVTVNSPAPAWADRCRVVVKSEDLTYYTIYCSIFFEDGVFRWIKLDGESRDKVQEGDWLIIKKDLTGPIAEVKKFKVLEKMRQDENFISGNNNDLGAEIIEPAGLYMKIKPDGVFIDYNQNEFIVDEGNGDTTSGQPVVRVDQLYREISDGMEPPTITYEDVAIPQGSIITLYFQSNGRDQFYVFEKTYTVQSSYDNFQDWFEENVTLPLNVPDSDQAYNDITFVRGLPAGNNGVTVTGDPSDPLFMLVRGLISGNGNKKGYLYTKVTIRLVDSLVIFETEPVQTDVDIYYETEQTFELVNGDHQGNVQNQTSSQPAIIESNFFNCFARGNGAEEYRVKAAVNKKFLRTDLKPTGVDLNGYKEVTRTCDITYGEAFNESSNINGVNVFNLSTANFKDDMEKQYGSIQKMFPRLGDILIFQEEKTGLVYFDKDAIYTADGNPNLISIPGVLGRYQPYAGDYGIGKHPESFSVDRKGRVKFASIKDGVIARLSIDGIEPVVYGLENFFTDLFLNQPNAKMITGYDPFLNETVFAIGNEPERLVQFGCSAAFTKSNQTEAFTYELKLNDLGGDVVINYSITQGTATITADFNGDTYGVSNVTGVGNLTFERTSLVENIVTITVTPIGGAISYSIMNSCPTGTELKIVSIILNDSDDTDQTIINKFKWNTSSFASTDELFGAGPVTRFETITGIEGEGIFPTNGALVTLQSLKDGTSSGHFANSECNRLGYLVSSNVYEAEDYQDILDNEDTQFVTVTETGEEGFAITNSGNFSFNRTDADEILYLIWDYTSRNPVIAPDSANVQIGQSVIIDVLANDEVGPDAVVTIPTQPTYGTAVVNLDKTITYTHDGSENFDDSFIYMVTDNGCSSTASVTIVIGVTCGDTLSASGSLGVYTIDINLGTDIGWAAIVVDAQSVPDRFELFWGETKVADSKYIGDGLVPGPPVAYTPTLLGEKTLDIFEYNGSPTPPYFNDTGDDVTFTVIQDDISNNTTEPTNGNHYLIFNKTTATPTTVRLQVTGTAGTGWAIQDVICPTPAEELIEGEEKFLYAFFPEASKDSVARSVKMFRGSSPDKFYLSKFGNGTNNLALFNWNVTNCFINDTVNWWQVDVNGNIVDTGTI